MVKRIVANDKMGVRFSLPAPGISGLKAIFCLIGRFLSESLSLLDHLNKTALNIEFHVKTGDNPVDFGHKRQ